ncbi:MAG TPA: VTT domain-containing protein [Pseudoneobacillus sp.]|nr:VTT domain-containing protein [Pseudoneobacillus sp.]
MTEYIFDWIPDSKLLIALFSIIVNVIIAISGILPSAFLTAVNITVFDFKMGLILSIIGEASGAIVSFFLYRKGLTKLSNKIQRKNKLLERLQHTKGLEAVILVLILRTLPFIPSGVVTLFAAYSKMGIYSFSIASTIGKIPSLMIEAYAMDRALELSTEWKIISLCLILFVSVIYLYWKNRRKKQ